MFHVKPERAGAVMADGGNFFSSIGLDVQLLTAGSAGGLVKALFGRQHVPDAIASMVAGALTSNYLGGPAASLLSSFEMFGLKATFRPEFGGFFVGIFAFAIVSLAAQKFREKFGKEDPPP